MGVITKNETKLHIRTSVSEETLYIPSEDEGSEVSVAVRHAQSRVLQRQRIPTVGATGSTVNSRSGKKKSRRYQNVSHLVTLAEEDELKEVSIEDFIESRSSFRSLLQDGSSLEKWEAFISSNEETQREMLEQDTKRGGRGCSTQKDVNSSVRGLLKNKNLPLGIIQYLEDQLIDFFSSMPRDIYISPELSSFERMLLHSLSDYHSLEALSFDSEPRKIRLVKVKNPRENFPQPSLLMTDFLASHLKCRSGCKAGKANWS